MFLQIHYWHALTALTSVAFECGVLQGADDGGIKASNAVSKAPTLAGVMAARNLKQADVIRDVRARLLHGVKVRWHSACFSAMGAG